MKYAPLILLSAFLVITACDTLDLMPEASQEAQTIAGTLSAQGYDLLAKEQPRPALAIFEQAIAANERDVHALQGKGIALNRLGKHGEAELAYGQALKVDPSAMGVSNNLAMSKILRGEYGEAISLLTPLAAKHPTNATVQENLALANCLIGKREDAKKLYSQRLPPAQVEENLKFCKEYEGMRKK